MSTNYAVYIRASTDKQADDHQRESIERWLSSEEADLAEAEMYVDIGSGVSERTVRRCIGDLQDWVYIKQPSDGQYYATMTLQPSIFHK